MELTIQARLFFLDVTVIIKQEPHIKVSANYEKKHTLGIFFIGVKRSKVIERWNHFSRFRVKQNCRTVINIKCLIYAQRRGWIAVSGPFLRWP